MSKSLNLGAIASQGGGISSRHTVSESFNTDANKNHLFFGPVVFQETVTITQDSNLILLKTRLGAVSTSHWYLNDNDPQLHNPINCKLRV